MLSRLKREVERHPWLRRLGVPAYLAYLSVANHLVNKIPLFSARHFIYRYVYGMRMGSGSAIAMGCCFFRPDLVRLGRNVRIHFGCLIDGRRGIVIGDNVDIAFNVMVFTLQHDLDDPGYASRGGPVVIGDRVCINSASIILPGVTLGEGAVVAAGSVVTKDVPSFSVVGGVPAKVIRARNRALTYALSDRRFFH